MRNRRSARKRAPTVSVLISLSLVIACVIFAGIRYLRGDIGASDSADPGNEPVESEQTPVMPTGTEISELPVDIVEIPISKPPAVKVRGIFVDVWTIGTANGLARFVDMCDSSEINAIVIDVKDDYGRITFTTDNESLTAASNNAIPDIEKTVARLKEHGIYTIARIVCFKDPWWCTQNAGAAIHSKSGATWKDATNVAWLDPYNLESWEYIATVAEEAARIGFDEIQLDYIRFPAEGNLGDINFGSVGDEKTKAEIIGEFLAYIRETLADAPVWLSADVFGIIAVRSGDFENIGQDLDIMLQNVDYVCPMIYPSHFAHEGQNGAGQIINGVLFEIPDLEPYGVVLNILQTVKDRLPDDGNHAVIRPYLQAFTASHLGNGYYMTYTEHEVYEQIKAVYEAGFDEWILWNLTGDYSIYENVKSLISSENSEGSSSGTPAVNNA